MGSTADRAHAFVEVAADHGRVAVAWVFEDTGHGFASGDQDEGGFVEGFGADA